jgi:hypothetical protein
MAIASHETSICEHPDRHKDGAKDKHWATAPAIHVDEGGNGHEDVDDILDGGGDQIDISGQSRHGENIGYIV